MTHNLVKDPPTTRLRNPLQRKFRGSESGLAASAQLEQTPGDVQGSQNAQRSKESRLEFHRTAHSFPDYGTVKGAVRMPPPIGSFVKRLAPQMHVDTLNSGHGCPPGAAQAATPRPPARGPEPKRRRFAYSDARLRGPEEDIADVERDAMSWTEHLGSQSSFSHSVSPGPRPGRSNRRRRQPQLNPTPAVILHGRRSGADREIEPIESFDELGPAPTPGPWQQRTARLISTQGARPPPVTDPADEFILGRPAQQVQDGRSGRRGKKRRGNEVVDDRDELGEESKARKISSPRARLLPAPISAKHGVPSLSRRGDMLATNWGSKTDGHFGLVQAAVCQPNLQYEHREGQSQCLLRPTEHSELRVFRDGDNPAEPYDWLKITGKARTLFHHPESELIRITQSMDSTLQIGGMMMIRFSSKADASSVVEWVKRNLRIDCREVESSKLVQMYDRLLGEVGKAAAQTRDSRSSDDASSRPATRAQDSSATPPELRGRLPSSCRAPVRHQMQVSAKQAQEPSLESVTSERRSMRTRQGVEQKQRVDSPRPPVIHRWSEEHPGWADDWKVPLMFHRTMVDKEDVPRLDEGQCLNDNLIGFGLRYLFDKFASRHPDLQKRVYLHNSFFYEKLKGPRGSIDYDGVKSWTAKVDLLSYDYIVVPVNEHFHWWVAIICNPGKLDPESGGLLAKSEGSTTELDVNLKGALSDVQTGGTATDSRLWQSQKSPTADVFELAKSDIVDLVSDDKNVGPMDQDAGAKARQSRKARSGPKTYNPNDPRIITLDSLGSSHPLAITHLRKYLLAEFQHKRKKVITNPMPQLGMRADNIPEQNNLCDCGVYLLGYIQEFVKDPDRFIQTLLRKESPDWDFNPSQLRELWRQTIQVEHTRYQNEQLGLQQRREASAAKYTPNGSAEPNQHVSRGASEVTNAWNSEPATTVDSPGRSASPSSADAPGNSNAREMSVSAASEHGAHGVLANGNRQSRSPDRLSAASPPRKLSQHEVLDEDVILLPPQEGAVEILPSVEAPEVEEMSPPPPDRRDDGPRFIAQLVSSPRSSSRSNGNDDDDDHVKEVGPAAFYRSVPGRPGGAPRRSALSSPAGGAHRRRAAKSHAAHTASHFVVDGSPGLGIPVVERAEVVRHSEPIDLT